MRSRSGGFVANHFGIIFGGIWLLVGLPFLAIGLAQWFNQARFDEHAVRVQGTVITKEVSRATRNRSTEYEVRYRFQGPDGELIEGRDDLDFDAWDALTEQGPIQVEYLETDPHTHRVAGHVDWVFILVFTLLGGVFSLAGAVIFGVSLKGRLSRSRLRKHGQKTVATVTSVEPTSMSINRVRQWRILYRYNDMYGVPHEGKSGYLSPDEAPKWKEGDQGEIFHDPQAPEKSLWVGADPKIRS